MVGTLVAVGAVSITGTANISFSGEHIPFKPAAGRRTITVDENRLIVVDNNRTIIVDNDRNIVT